MFKIRINSFLRVVTCHPLGWIGTLAVTFGVIFTFMYISLLLYFGIHNQYVGILFMSLVPPMFFGGLLLIPLGILLRVRAIRKAEENLTHKPFIEVIYKVAGTKKPGSAGVTFLLLTCANIVLSGVILMSSYEYMESNEFCGKVCHTIMEPEYLAYQRSPHARVNCVDCHIGPGAGWFVKSKLSGARQLVAVFTGDYSRPIPTPIQHLRPSRETCQQCHWPDKFHGENLKVITQFDTDRNNTKLYTVLLLKIGGPNTVPGKASGVHWHVGSGNRVTFISEGDLRKEIPWVRFEKDGKEPVEYFFTGSDLTDEEIKNANKREMECIDCHNRPTHVYEMPEDAIDHIMLSFPALQSIPYLKKAGLEILKETFTEQEIVDGAVASRVLTWYQDNEKTLGTIEPELLQKAAEEIQSTYRRNVWPRMNIEWGTYPTHLSHIHSLGCLRCHGNTHRTKEGKTISSSCQLCHTILALKKPNPPILKILADGS